MGWDIQKIEKKKKIIESFCECYQERIGPQKFIGYFKRPTIFFNQNAEQKKKLITLIFLFSTVFTGRKKPPYMKSP
jgi:hypothetical protein